MKYIGLDAHPATFTLAVVDEEGEVIHHVKRASSGQNLIEVVSQVTGPKQMAVEESTLAQWSSLILKPYVAELTVCDPRHNRWIVEADHADAISAIRPGYAA